MTVLHSIERSPDAKPSTSPRYDIPAYSSGWFLIGWSHKLPARRLMKVRQFGTTLTLFRGEDGKLGLLDDVCPHLGARFSEGGCVQGNAVRCPYHHWSFDKTGACTDIPYAKKIPKNARVRTHPVVERNGMIFMYRDQNGAAPIRDLPEIDGFDPDRYCAPAAYEFEVRIHGQDIMENSVDSAHFQAVHGHAMPSVEYEHLPDRLRVTQKNSVRRFGTNVDFQMVFHLLEPGFHYVEFSPLFGVKSLVVSSVTPIDEEHTAHRMSFFIERSRVPGWSRILRQFLLWQMLKTYREDMQIWESKEYQSKPVLCDGDRGIMKLRRWYGRFLDTSPHVPPLSDTVKLRLPHPELRRTGSQP